MGGSHARGYAALPGYQIAGFVVAKNVERAKKLAKELKVDAPVYTDYYQAMKEVKPEVVSINTYVDTHAAFSTHAMRQGCHVFMEKPIAKTVKEAEEVAAGFPADRAQAGDRLHPARAPGLDEVHRAGPHPGQAADHAHEPEPAELRQGMGPAQDLHRQHAAPGGLRRALRGRDVPDDPGQAEAGAGHRGPGVGGGGCRQAQLRHAAGGVRRRLGGLVRGGLGPDDEPQRLLRQGRGRPQGLREHRQGHHQRGPLGRVQARRGGQHHPALQRGRHRRLRREEGPDHQDPGRAGPQRAVQAGAGGAVQAITEDTGPDRPRGRRGEQPEDLLRGGGILPEAARSSA